MREVDVVREEEGSAHPQHPMRSSHAPPLTSGQGGRYGSSMRFSFSTGTFYHRRLGYSLDLARATGYDGVELVLAPPFVLGGLDAVAQRSPAASVLSVHPPFIGWPGWPRTVVERIPRVVSITRDLGASVTVVHIHPFMRMDAPQAAHFRAALQRGRAVASEASPPISIAIETNQYSMRRWRFPLDDLKRLADFAHECGCGITLDTCHAGANQEDLLASYEIVRPLLRNIHLSDVRWINGRPRTHVMPGEGTLPLRELLVTLARDGYDGLVTLELHPREVRLFNRGRAERRLRQALDFMRDAVALAPSARGE